MKCRKRQATDPQKVKTIVQLSFFLVFLWNAIVEAEAIGVEAEAVEEIAASTSLIVAYQFFTIFFKKKRVSNNHIDIHSKFKNLLSSRFLFPPSITTIKFNITMRRTFYIFIEVSHANRFALCNTLVITRAVC